MLKDNVCVKGEPAQRDIAVAHALHELWDGVKYILLDKHAFRQQLVQLSIQCVD